MNRRPATQPSGAAKRAADTPGPVRSIGRPLEDSTRQLMEGRLGADLSRVRIYANEPSARAAPSLGAAAFTAGDDVRSGPGRNGPLAWDLAHVVQASLKVGAIDDPLEHDADAFADRAGCGCTAGGGSPGGAARGTPSGPVLRRRAGDPGAAPDGGLVRGLDLGPGRPLGAAQREFFESRVGHDLAGVRIHTDARAGQAAERIGASAFTIGRDIAFAPAEYRPGTSDGRHLLAHEIAHVVQQRAMNPGVLRRQPAQQVSGWDRIRHSGPVDWKPGMRATLVSDIDDRDHVEPDVKVKGGSLVEVVANPGFGQIEVRLVDPKAALKKSWWINDVRLEPVGAPAATPTANPPGGTTASPLGGPPGGTIAVPVTVQYELLGRLGDVPGPGSSPGVVPAGPGSSFGLGAAGLRSTAISGARGLGFLLSPPIRGPLDPLLPLASRLGEPPGPLGVSGDVAILERYLTSPARELTPRYASEAGELWWREGAGQSWWRNNFGLTEHQLGQMPGLVTRMARDGIDSLSLAEQQLVMTFLNAHAQSTAVPGLKIASPAISTTVREGLSAVPEAAPLFREAPYVVRIQVPSSAVVDVNAALGANRLPNLLYEREVLVFTDARGAITRVMPNPVSGLGRSALTLRWVGRGFIVVAAAVSVGRIATATPQELPRVIGEEGGGWLGGIGGSAIGAGACITLGIATEGLGLLLCGAIGGIGGGFAGSYAGGELGEAAGNKINETLETAGQVINPVIERAMWGDKPIPPIGYEPPPLYGQQPHR